MATTGSIINLALKQAGILGVGQTASAEDSNDAFTLMNMMLAQWQRDRWLVWHLVTTSVVSTGAQSYTVGSGGNYNISPRPDQIESAFLRQINVSSPNQPDYPLEQLYAKEDYDMIRLKSLSSFPTAFFYDSAFPTGTIYFWPIPLANIYSMHITYKAILSQFTSLSQTVVLPAEYEAALLYNLAVRLRIHYQLPERPDLMKQAKNALNLIRNANTQVPRLRMPADVVRPGIYDYYSDRSY